MDIPKPQCICGSYGPFQKQGGANGNASWHCETCTLTFWLQFGSCIHKDFGISNKVSINLFLRKAAMCKKKKAHLGQRGSCCYRNYEECLCNRGGCCLRNNRESLCDRGGCWLKSYGECVFVIEAAAGSEIIGSVFVIEAARGVSKINIFFPWVAANLELK